MKTMKAAMNKVAKWVYWILGLLLVGVACYYIYNVMTRPVAGILVFMGGILALYFYYVKWFVIPEKRPDWPPYQTVCPDYLTPVSPGYDMSIGTNGKTVATPKQGGQFKCVDFVGVSRNGRLKRASPANLQSQITQGDYTFPVNPNEKPQALKARLQSYGLTWVSMFGDD